MVPEDPIIHSDDYFYEKDALFINSKQNPLSSVAFITEYDLSRSENNKAYMRKNKNFIFFDINKFQWESSSDESNRD